LFVCLYLCLLATSRKNYWSDLAENFTRDVSVDKKQLTSSHPRLDPDLGILKGFFNIAR